jgi:hypothetical protein
LLFHNTTALWLCGVSRVLGRQKHLLLGLVGLPAIAKRWYRCMPTDGDLCGPRWCSGNLGGLLPGTRDRDWIEPKDSRWAFHCGPRCGSWGAKSLHPDITRPDRSLVENSFSGRSSGDDQSAKP